MRKSVNDTDSQALARQIMGRNFFGITQVSKRFKVTPTKQQLKQLAKIPFSEVTLHECADTHLLMATFPLSLVDIQTRVGSLIALGSDRAWWRRENFSVNTAPACWQLIRKTPVPNSLKLSWEKQQLLLLPSEQVPTVNDLVQAIVCCYLITGDRLFQDKFVRCADIATSNYPWSWHVPVGHFIRPIIHRKGVPPVALWIFASNVFSDDSCGLDVGIASARRPDVETSAT